MLRSKPIATQVLESLARNAACEFQQLVEDCSEFTWKQLFYEVDRLSQLGQLCLTSIDGGHYFIRLPFTEETIKSGQRFTRSETIDPPAVARPDDEPRSVQRVDRYSWIAQRAYQLYEAQGRRDGHTLEHWLQAEQEIQLICGCSRNPGCVDSVLDRDPVPGGLPGGAPSGSLIDQVLDADQ
ncbi:MAG TPA: DUF2934 domain-containing protein [Nitrospira sp.]